MRSLFAAQRAALRLSRTERSASQSKMSQLVLASNNPGKLREFRRLLEPLGIASSPRTNWVSEAANRT
jgi:hypothetical protein